MNYFNLKNYKPEDEVSLTYFDTKGDNIKTVSTTNKKKDKLEVKKGHQPIYMGYDL